MTVRSARCREVFPALRYSADNPPTYDACHDCGRPSWTCATCGIVNPSGRRTCNECHGTMPAELLGDREEGFEMTYEEWVAIRLHDER